MKIRCSVLRPVSLSLMVAISAMVGVKDAQAEPQVMHVEVSHYGGGGPNECGKDRECHGARTACGQVFNMYGISVAHKSLPCGTEVQFGTAVVVWWRKSLTVVRTWRDAVSISLMELHANSALSRMVLLALWRESSIDR